MTMTIRKKTYRGVVAVAVTAMAALMASTSMFLWWAYLDPIIPDDFRVEASSVANISHPAEVILQRPGVFEVTRVINSPRNVNARFMTSFETAPDASVLRADGRVITPDNTRVEIASQRVTFHRGIEKRSRLFEVPKILPPGDYVVSTRVEFCNPLRCEELSLPPIPVTLGSDGWPEKVNAPRN